MAHFAQLDENNQVIQVIVVSDENTSDINGNEVEEIGIAFCKNLLGDDTRWVQTSYNNNFRKRYGYIGCSYDEVRDAFISPKPPFESWIINEDTLEWESPIGDPPNLTQEEKESNLYYQWNEENQKWILKQ